MTNADTLVIEEERYDRQKLLWGDAGQDRLKNARVSVIGLDFQGKYVALCLAALGVGNVVLIDGKNTIEEEERGTFMGTPVSHGSRALAYAELLRRVNPQIRVEGYPTDLVSRIDQDTLTGSTVIVDATNMVTSKRNAILFGHEHHIPVLSTSSQWGYTKLVRCDSESHDLAYLMPMFEGNEQDELMALLMCGVTTEEVRKLIFNDKDILQKPVRYRLGDGYRFGFPKEGEMAPRPDATKYADLRVAFLGAGAIGCWGAIAAAKMGIDRVDVFDYDTFDSTNINRQVLGFDGVGELKAVHIAKKIVEMSLGRTHSDGFNVKILPGFETEREYDVVFDFVDNPYTRALNTAHAISHNIPMISSGALPYSARSITQVAGKTFCQDCLYQIYDRGRQDEMIRRASCAANPDPSVVMSNAVAGALAVLEIFTLVEPEKYGVPFSGEIMYRSSAPTRFGAEGLTGACDCYSNPVPQLEISDEDVAAFANAIPHVLTGGLVETERKEGRGLERGLEVLTVEQPE
ncbi:hypothetical protein COV17_03650 [Candidatus Woesearchaeota archaeon CG10_big_fil_rev_8_21_14_0_10_36_11]|nr:MAG: hypothetical protein COV17_03650 [Candidatus Woesearchaeota archaeon CG10_big_fil_rev_8_21_14_0_10_36_11]